MDRLASCVFFIKLLPMKFVTRPQSPCIANQRDTRPWTNQRHCCHYMVTCCRLNHAPNYYRSPWLVKEILSTCIVLQNLDVNNQNTAMSSMFEGDLMFMEKIHIETQRKWYETYVSSERKVPRSKANKIIALYSFIKLQPPKVHFNHVLLWTNPCMILAMILFATDKFPAITELFHVIMTVVRNMCTTKTACQG